MKRTAFCVMFACVQILTIGAQIDNSSMSDYEKFRRQTLGDFEGFRSNIFEEYDKFLDGVWKEYELFVGEKRDPRPKPQKQPQYSPSVKPDAPVEQKPTVPQPNQEDKDNLRQDPPVLPQPIKPVIDFQSLSFYDVNVQTPKIDYTPLLTLENSQFGLGWRILKGLEVEQRVLPVLEQTALSCNLNDWFFYELCMAYSNAVLGNGTSASRLSLVHYMLVHHGLDARLGRTDEAPFLLLPMRQMVYARSYLTLGTDKYHVFSDQLTEIVRLEKQRFYCCDIPKDKNTGRKLDLIVRPLIMPVRNKPFSINHDGMTLDGVINITLMEMVKHYPQMPVPDYARSVLSKELRQKVIQQMKTQLTGYQGVAAVNRLLRFVQKGFDYSTDQDFHGYEKPYFFEETLFYPKCDCEDRSVFFAYLAKEVLGVDNCLVRYPGHECTAIIHPNLNGDHFVYNNTVFYITDPTYIGANAGMCMDQFKAVSPIVEWWY